MFASFVPEEESNGVEEDDKSGYHNHSLNCETAPIRPECGTPLPIHIGFRFQDDVGSHDEAEEQDSLDGELESSVARCLIIFHNQKINNSSHAGWNKKNPSREVRLPTLFQEIEWDHHHSQRHQ